MLSKKVHFPRSPIPYIFIAPQLLIIAVFFFWPACQAVYLSFMLEDPWGLSTTFVWFENYQVLFTSAEYLATTIFTLVYCALVVFFSLGLALLLAVKANSVVHGQSAYRLLLTWVYAVAPAVAGITAYFLFNRHIGILFQWITQTGWDFAPETNAFDASVKLVLVSVWKQVPVNFIFFLSGLQSIPRSVREAALIDNRSATSRFWDVTFPLLAPTGFFLLIINITYALFDTFGVIDTMVKGEPGNNPMTLVYKVYVDGFRGNDLGGSSAQSVVLMVLVLALTVFQFRLVERRIHYT